MTVASLWSILEQSKCGTSVGITDMLPQQQQQLLQQIQKPQQPIPSSSQNNNFFNNINPISSSRHNSNSINNSSSSSSNNSIKSLAIDLSIWICEALTSKVLSTYHTDPALHLVSQRTFKLTKMGIKLIFVVEGKRRRRQSHPSSSANEQGFKQQRGNNNDGGSSPFRKACSSCEAFLKMFGVPVVRATAEGEALCALLDREGLVDGVISNDADCFLFGARVVYANFSIESLERGEVVRFRAEDIWCDVADVVDDDGDEEEDGGDGGVIGGLGRGEVISLCREDLIAFAILTGSDLAGDGLPNVGGKKAVRFVHTCRKLGTSALEEIRSWTQDVTECGETMCSTSDVSMKNQPHLDQKIRCCTVCLHPGNRRSHERHGCDICGTHASQPCIRVTEEEKFRRFIRSKASFVTKRCDLNQIIDAYLQPVDNVFESCSSLQIKYPRMHDILRSNTLCLKGQSLDTSREYVWKSIPKLLARLEVMSCDQTSPFYRANILKDTAHTIKAVPSKITKKLVHKSQSCFEVQWSLVSTSNASSIQTNYRDYSFSTREWESLIEAAYPNIVTAFFEDERRRIQGLNKIHRQKMFTGSSGVSLKRCHEAMSKDEKRLASCNITSRRIDKKQKRRFFGLDKVKNKPNISRAKNVPEGKGDDVATLMRFISNPDEKDKNECHSSLGDSFLDEERLLTPCRNVTQVRCDDCTYYDDDSFSLEEDLFNIMDDRSAIEEEEDMQLLENSKDVYTSRHESSSISSFNNPSPKQKSHYRTKSKLLPLTSYRKMICDMGIQIEMSPIGKIRKTMA